MRIRRLHYSKRCKLSSNKYLFFWRSWDVWLSYVAGYSAIIAIFSFGFSQKVIKIWKRSVYQKALSFLDLHRCHKPNMNHDLLSSQNVLPLSSE
ncbi:uncharacterized protein LOC143469783 [Clavelina lepadiformis]|uniref:uncharacterized protein LOC143469783 n=1 Tax=Clavelina lepadiformis TaxID=159417 RepID=UPI0040414FDF